MSIDPQKWHVFEVTSTKVTLSETALKEELETYLKTQGFKHEVAFAKNKPNCLRFKVASEVCDHTNISAFTSKVGSVVPDASTTCPGFGVENHDLQNFEEKKRNATS